MLVKFFKLNKLRIDYIFLLYFVVGIKSYFLNVVRQRERTMYAKLTPIGQFNVQGPIVLLSNASTSE